MGQQVFLLLPNREIAGLAIAHVSSCGLAKQSKRGRPPAGLGGNRVSDYRQTSVWLPVDAHRLFDALKKVKGYPGWRVMVEALQAYEAALPVAERRLVQHVIKQLTSRQQS